MFASENIKKGTKIYCPNIKLDLLLTEKQFNELNESEKEIIKHYGYFDKKLGKWHLAHDDIRYCNHSTNPNIGLLNENLVALRDIKKDEEILQNYSDFEESRQNIK
ncbi:MAG TPA: SET domain-containing protein [Candidatus Nanoarchaeia archaeon]|nr:SET domain-containing protein [Candidatus Nanoarchaeia archaeon]